MKIFIRVALLLLFLAGAAFLVTPSALKANKSIYAINVEQLINSARLYKNIPYRYGGTTPVGFDCSGFTFYVFNKSNVNLPRTSSAQSTIGNFVGIDQVRPGDLIFFGKGKKVSHVGIATSNFEDGPIMIHASSSKGIIETNLSESKYWQKRYIKSRRLINPEEQQLWLPNRLEEYISIGKKITAQISAKKHVETVPHYQSNKVRKGKATNKKAEEAVSCRYFWCSLTGEHEALHRKF